MFLTFKIIVVIHLIIPSIYAKTSPSSNNKITLSLKEQVKEELGPLEDGLKNIMDSSNSVDSKLELGRILGQMQKIIEQKIKAEKKAEEKIETLIEDKGVLKTEMKEANKYRLLLGMTYRIDTLESMMAPDLNFKGKSRVNRWMSIFNLKTEAVSYLRKKVTEAGMTKMSFIYAIERLCDERNNMAGHARISLPKNIDDRTIREALEIMKIIDDKYTVEAVKIIIAPIDGVDFNTTTTTGATDKDEAQGAIDEASFF